MNSVDTPRRTLARRVEDKFQQWRERYASSFDADLALLAAAFFGGGLAGGIRGMGCWCRSR